MELLEMINKVIQGDCLPLLKELPDKCIDLVLTDPPYGINIEDNYAIGGRNDKLKDLTIDWDNEIPKKEVFNEMERVSKEQIIFGANYFNCFNGERGAIIWDKFQPLPTASQCEIASYSRLKKVFKYTERWTNFVNTKTSGHPTEKPVSLMEWIIANFTQENDLVLDCFLGSGTTAVACKKLNRRFIGLEISEEYCAIARQRLAQGVLNFLTTNLMRG